MPNPSHVPSDFYQLTPDEVRGMSSYGNPPHQHAAPTPAWHNWLWTAVAILMWLCVLGLFIADHGA